MARRRRTTVDIREDVKWREAAFLGGGQIERVVASTVKVQGKEVSRGTTAHVQAN